MMKGKVSIDPQIHRFFFFVPTDLLARLTYLYIYIIREPLSRGVYMLTGCWIAAELLTTKAWRANMMYQHMALSVFYVNTGEGVCGK